MIAYRVLPVHRRGFTHYEVFRGRVYQFLGYKTWYGDDVAKPIVLEDDSDLYTTEDAAILRTKELNK